MGNQTRKPHNTNQRGSNHDKHTAADGFGKGKVKCPTCLGKGVEKWWVGDRYEKRTCRSCGGRGKLDR